MPEYDLLESGLKRADIFSQFLPYRRMRPVDTDPYLTGFSYVFFVSPCMNLVSDWAVQQLGHDMDGTDPAIVKSLCYAVHGSDMTGKAYEGGQAGKFSGLGTESPFIKHLTNLALGAPSTDVSLETKDYAENFVGNKVVFGNTTFTSRTAGDFQVRFRELDTLPVLRTINLWVRYIECAKMGTIPRASEIAKARLMDYFSSAYVFSTLADGMTLGYWAKYTGCFPTAVPWTSLGTDDTRTHDAAEVTVPFIYNYREEMNPEILADFNYVNNSESINPDLPNRDRIDFNKEIPVVNKANVTERRLLGGSDGADIEYQFASTKKVMVKRFLTENQRAGIITNTSTRYILDFE